MSFKIEPLKHVSSWLYEKISWDTNLLQLPAFHTYNIFNYTFASDNSNTLKQAICKKYNIEESALAKFDGQNDKTYIDWITFNDGTSINKTTSNMIIEVGKMVLGPDTKPMRSYKMFVDDGLIKLQNPDMYQMYFSRV